MRTEIEWSWLWIAVLAALVQLCRCARDDAFIGYQEKSSECIDTNDNCEKWSKGVLSQCIDNPFYMRQNCRKVPLDVGIFTLCFPTQCA